MATTPTKRQPGERAAHAREVREAAARRHRRRRTLAAVLGVAVVAVVGGLAAVTIAARTHPTASAATASITALPMPNGYGAAAVPPWPTPADPRPGARAAGLQVAPMAQMAQMGPMGEHFHAHLDVLVDGNACCTWRR